MNKNIDRELDNIDNLKEFLVHHNLRHNGNGVYRFKSQILGNVGGRKLQFISNVQTAIQNGDRAGTIAFHDAEDSCPGDFRARWQQYTFESNSDQLMITGTHPQYGKYEFFVKPL